MKQFLVSYDICEPRRLQRIHKLLKAWGIPLQKSVFIVDSSRDIVQLKQLLLETMDQSEDDIRLYPIFTESLVWEWEDKSILEGILLC
ncbi:CRISPR-associated endonuclease Cas2 [Ignatzschineria ureiclastica]|uniref:CRISPR-associated endoribonuclease Cas2 n=1 Tax=Ignatzschineria ureiclastica TaxID=472582 RepID=A0A2U2AEY8_9GAMM|nr:CRISPR-associated endonuclease Cas2 [Ignatzschineria ureiclastica]PWD81221.1 CRISPR-associated endonuclease Cas2 [Ignatzschineria ureiclastica]GGZ97238.1 hypothetical protein GCM10007162_11740 [Ignatzschineria ureiclastica]